MDDVIKDFEKNTLEQIEDALNKAKAEAEIKRQAMYATVAFANNNEGITTEDQLKEVETAIKLLDVNGLLEKFNDTNPAKSEDKDVTTARQKAFVESVSVILGISKTDIAKVDITKKDILYSDLKAHLEGMFNTMDESYKAKKEGKLMIKDLTPTFWEKFKAFIGFTAKICTLGIPFILQYCGIGKDFLQSKASKKEDLVKFVKLVSQNSFSKEKVGKALSDKIKIEAAVVTTKAKLDKATEKETEARKVNNKAIEENNAAQADTDLAPDKKIEATNAKNEAEIALRNATEAKDEAEIALRNATEAKNELDNKLNRVVAAPGQSPAGGNPLPDPTQSQSFTNLVNQPNQNSQGSGHSSQ